MPDFVFALNISVLINTVIFMFFMSFDFLGKTDKKSFRQDDNSMI